MSDIKPTIVFISTYPPRECGIATFTQDLFEYCQKILGSSVSCRVAALNVSPLDTYNYPPEVAWEIDQNNMKDYLDLADDVNNDPSISGVILQHEYGIFGGVDGENILLFMKHCKKPIIVTLHTALPLPSIKMQTVTGEIIEQASNIVVLTKKSKEIIEQLYPHSIGKTVIIPHGIHEVSLTSQEEFKEKLELSDHIILSTFGLLSRGKGIEYMIRALPEVIRKHPTVLYLILGETHPVIRRNEGEEYRLTLAKLVTKLGLQKHVKFYDQYLSLPDLLEFLQATDVYISTSINPNQAVSGTLSYALGTGRPVVSTEFAQSKEVITPDIGRLVPIQDSEALTAAILALLSDRDKLKDMARNAYDKTRPMLWSNVAGTYTKLLAETIVPPIRLQHLITMTDDIGLFQFAKLSVPNQDTGYTLDDNARALVTCSWLLELRDDDRVQNLASIYLKFIERCQQADGSFMNYIGYHDNLPTTQNADEDLEEAQARTLWALSEVMQNHVFSSDTRKHAKKLFLKTLTQSTTFTHLRAKAFAIKAFALALDTLPENREVLLTAMKQYADSLMTILKDTAEKSWYWFEKDLNYNNALLSESLLIAGSKMHTVLYKENGILSLTFLIGKTFSSEMYLPIGHSHWYENNAKRSQFDQQPEDPASMIIALATAYELTKNEEYKNLANKCFSWFMGNNSLGQPLYDEKTGGCFDGLHPDRVNQNQGAESLISYLMANITLTKLRQLS